MWKLTTLTALTVVRVTSMTLFLLKCARRLHVMLGWSRLLTGTDLYREPCISVTKKYPFPISWWTEFEVLEGQLCMKEVHRYYTLCVKFHMWCHRQGN